MFEISSGNIQIGNWIFNEIHLKDKDMYSEYIKVTEYPANLWSSNFDYLWASGQSSRKKILWKVIDGMLVTFAYTNKNKLYLMCLPFGKGGPDKVVEVLKKCLGFCYKIDDYDASESVVRLINSMQLDFLKKTPEFEKHFIRVPMVGLEKHFSVPMLASLKGKDFRRVREKVNRFCNYYPDASIRKYTKDDFDQVMQLGEHWSDTSGKKYTTIFDKVYFREIVKHSDELNHIILVVEEKGKIIGMVSGGELPTGQSWGCLTKFMKNYDGLSEFMIVKFAQELNKINPKIEYMNTGSDLGPGGLRAYKDKFRPVLSLKRYRLKLR